jgi:ferredoxin
LAQKGKSLSGGYSISMPGNYIKMIDYEETEQSRKLSTSKNEIETIANKILSCVTEVSPDKRGFISNIVNSIWQQRVKDSDKSFFATGSCNSCGICEKVCPVNNIKIANDRPEWRHKCEECLSCIHFCPQLAIQTQNTRNRSRHHHPEIAVDEMINAKNGRQI